MKMPWQGWRGQLLLSLIETEDRESRLHLAAACHALSALSHGASRAAVNALSSHFEDANPDFARLWRGYDQAARYGEWSQFERVGLKVPKGAK